MIILIYQYFMMQNSVFSRPLSSELFLGPARSLFLLPFRSRQSNDSPLASAVSAEIPQVMFHFIAVYWPIRILCVDNRVLQKSRIPPKLGCGSDLAEIARTARSVPTRTFLRRSGGSANPGLEERRQSRDANEDNSETGLQDGTKCDRGPSPT